MNNEVMLFYRIENETRHGCYVGYYNQNGEWSFLNCDCSNRHPFPTDDSLLCKSLGNTNTYLVGDKRYGFMSVEQFRSWFYEDSDLTKLQEYGFHMAIYDVPAAKFFTGNSQCVIASEVHTEQYLVETKSLSEFISIPA